MERLKQNKAGTIVPQTFLFSAFCKTSFARSENKNALAYAKALFCFAVEEGIRSA